METTNKTHWRKCDKSEFLGAADLDEIHGDLKAVIKNVTMTEVNPSGKEKSVKRIAHFEGDLKPMILNVVNAKVLKNHSGSKYIEDWQHITVSIYVLEGIKMMGETKEGLRFREILKAKPHLKEDSDPYKKAVKYLKEGGTITDIEKKYIVTKPIQTKLISDAETV